MCLGIIISAVFLGFYCAWIFLSIPLYFFFFETIVMLIILRYHYIYQKYSQDLMASYRGIFDDEIMYEKLINKYGVYIYAPHTAVNISLSFTASMLMGYFASAILLIMQRWGEAALCFVNACLCEFISAWLNPIPFLIAHAEHNRESDSCKHIPIIEDLRNLAGIHQLLNDMETDTHRKLTSG